MLVVALTNCQFCIVGAGVVGLSIADALISSGYKDIVILEKEQNCGVHASGRNSGVLHSGIYYPEDTLKAQFCLKGNEHWTQFCKKFQLPYLNNGKVLICRNDDEIETLSIIAKRARANGASIEHLDESTLSKVEPFAKTYREALFVKNTAVVDPKSILFTLKEQLLSTNKVKIRFGSRVKNISTNNFVETNHGKFHADFIINAAGGNADKIAHSMGVATEFRLIPFKGSYKKLSHGSEVKINSNIYPVPNLKNPFLGIHFTKSISGDVYIGPNASPALGTENYHGFQDFSSNTLSTLWADFVLFMRNSSFRRLALTEPKFYFSRFYYQEAQKMVKQLKISDIESSDKVGIRPQLVNWDTKELVNDFIVRKSKGSLHILNAISPAFTSAPAFATHIVEQL